MNPDQYKIDLPLLRNPHFGEYVKNNYYKIISSSPISYRKAVYKLAIYFKREFGYDFIQYSHDNNDDEKCHAYLWAEDFGTKLIPIGACCFRWREYKDYKPGWALQWIWFHPFERGKGHLSKAWDFFENKYGKDFYCEPPLSNAMKSFLEKRGLHEHTVGVKE